MKNYLSALLLALISFACSTDSPLEFEGDPRPILQGLALTREHSPEPIGKWGDPLIPTSRDFAISLPFPNPAKGHTQFLTRLPAPAQVRIWATPAVFSSQLGYTTQGGAIIQAPLSMRQIEIQNEMIHQAGQFTFRWDIDAAVVPSGPYRVYMSANNKLSWVDLWVYTSSADAPPFFRNMF